MIIRYTAPVGDSSGYGCAARNNIGAMIEAGITLTVNPVSFEIQHTSHGKLGQLINNYINIRRQWDINIIHLTPENWPKFIEPSKYNIGYTVWETSRLPVSWVSIINTIDEVWVPSEWNKQIFIDSGVKIPIKVVPHTLDSKIINESYDINNLANDKFKFYSIFQWTERKNPVGLLTAYLSEFTDKDNVTLFLKTYLMGWDLMQQVQIKDKVRAIKDKLGLSSYPQIHFMGNLLSTNDVHTIHYAGDCLVSPHRGEGTGLTIMESMLFGKPVICTNWSGNLQFTKPSNSYLIDYDLVQVQGMPWDKYSSDQSWAEPNILDLKAKMRYVYNNQDKAKETGQLAQQDILNNYTYSKIGTLIKNLLEVINNGRSR